MMPAETSAAIVEDELEGVRAWAERHGVPIEWHPETFELRLVLTQPSSGELFYLRGRFDDYPEVAPAWTFCSPEWADEGKRFFPARASGPARMGTVMHPNGVICAPFNRLAYAAHGGPHKNWGGPAQWITPKRKAVFATKIGDMVQRIMHDVRRGDGRMT